MRIIYTTSCKMIECVIVLLYCMCSWTQEHGSVAVPSHFYTIVTSCNNSIITNITKCPSDNLKIVAFLTINTNTVIPEVRLNIQLLSYQC